MAVGYLNSFIKIAILVGVTMSVGILAQVPNRANYIFEGSNLKNDTNIVPVLANGHIGFVPYGDTIYMNGLYNGFKNNSHRARIPNLSRYQFDNCRLVNDSPPTASDPNQGCSYSLDMFQGTFTTRANFTGGNFTVEQTQFAHRFFDRAIVNQITLKRNTADTAGMLLFWLKSNYEFCLLSNQSNLIHSTRNILIYSFRSIQCEFVPKSADLQ